MRETVRKITEQIQKLWPFNKPDSTAVIVDDPIVETFITGFNCFNKDKNKYEFEGVDVDYSKFRYLLGELYSQVLKEDDCWHFFMEGSYNILRFSARFAARVEKILDVNNAVYIEDFEQKLNTRIWIDEQPITKEYQQHFAKIFHEYSVMAVTIEDYTLGKLNSLADRVIHCFFNHQFINFQDDLRKNCNLEAWLTANLGASRAFYTGTLVARKEAYAQAREDIKKEYEERIANAYEVLDRVEKIAGVNAIEIEDLKSRVEALGAEEEERTIQ